MAGEFGIWTKADKLHKLRMQIKKSDFMGHVLAVDPGETTGWALLECRPDATNLVNQGQIVSWPLEVGVPRLETLIKELSPNFVVYEAYHVYAWRLNEHKFSEVPTIQIIGALKTLSVQRGVPYGCQTAQTGKAFFTDDRLKSMDLYVEGERHARDALRHACQFVTFGLKPITG